MYELNTIFTALNLTKTELASFLGITRGALHYAMKTKMGIPQQHLDTLLAVDLCILLCDSENVVMEEIQALEKKNAEILANSLRTQRAYCETQIIKLSAKLNDMVVEYENEKRALNNFLYISEHDKLLKEEYHDWIKTHTNILRYNLSTNAPDQQELMAVKIEALEKELEILEKRMK